MERVVALVQQWGGRTSGMPDKLCFLLENRWALRAAHSPLVLLHALMQRVLSTCVPCPSLSGIPCHRYSRSSLRARGIDALEGNDKAAAQVCAAGGGPAAHPPAAHCCRPGGVLDLPPSCSRLPHLLMTAYDHGSELEVSVALLKVWPTHRSLFGRSLVCPAVYQGSAPWRPPFMQPQAPRAACRCITRTLKRCVFLRPLPQFESPPGLSSEQVLERLQDEQPSDPELPGSSDAEGEEDWSDMLTVYASEVWCDEVLNHNGMGAHLRMNWRRLAVGGRAGVWVGVG